MVVFPLQFFVYGQHINLDTQKVSDDIRHLIEKTNSVGTSVVITTNDSILYLEEFGYADIEKNIPVTGQTLFGLGSITKTFTALGILKLVDAGKLSLGDNILDLAPELPITNKWEKNFPVRVYHLLEHTSGFDELHPKNGSIPVPNDEFPLLDGINLVKNSLKTRWEPGSRFAYSNTGYLVAGYIIEKISGKSYNDFIKTEVLEGLEMNQSTIRLNEINPDVLAKSYSTIRKALPYKHVFTRPTASLFSSAMDMSRFLQLLLHIGGMEQQTFLNDRIIQELEAHRSIKLFQNTENGYRRGIFPRFYNGVKWYGHGGSFNQYNSEFEYSHERGIGIFVVSSGPHATRTVDGILEILHSEIDGKPASPSAASPLNLENTFTGYYVMTSPRNQLLYPFTELFNGGLFIKDRDNNLFISGIDSPEQRLFVTGENKLSSSQDKLGYQYIFDNSTRSFYSSLGFRYEKKPFLSMLALASALIVSLVIVLFSQLTLAMKIIMSFTSKRRNMSMAQTLLEISGSILFIGVLSFLLSGSLENVHKPNTVSIILFITTTAFPVITFAGTLLQLRENFKNKSFKSKTYAVGLSASLLFISVYLCYWDIFAFRIWSY